MTAVQRLIADACIIISRMAHSEGRQGSGRASGDAVAPGMVGVLGYALALLLVALPLVDAAAQLAPLHPGDVTWRVGAVGLLSRSMLLPAAGALLGYLVAVRLGHLAVQRLVSVASGVAALALLAAIALFVLDVLQARALVAVTDRRTLDVISLLAVAKLTAFAFLAVVLSVAGWRSARCEAGERRETPHLVSAAGSGAAKPQT